MAGCSAQCIKRFSYARIDGPLGSTALSGPDGQPLNMIAQGIVGVHHDTQFRVQAKFLSHTFIYDYAREQTTIGDSVSDEVIGYDKILRKSIQAPVYFGGTASPDFMYIPKTAEGKLSLKFIVKAKDVDPKAKTRETEQLRIVATYNSFQSVSGQSVSAHFAPRLKRYDIVRMIKQVVSQ